MKKRKIVSVILLVSVLVICIFGVKLLLEFNDYRYTVKANDEARIFSENFEMVNIYPNLERIFIWGGDEVGKIDGLDNLTSLKKLVIMDNQVDKIEGLDNLSNLEYLSITNSGIDKIEDLDNLGHLSSLFLQNNNISTIENIEKIPLIKNDYCYTFKVGEEDEVSYPYTKSELDGSRIAEDCFTEEEPDEYIEKYLYNDEFKYGEMISPLSRSTGGAGWPAVGISVYGNPLTSITQESYDYIEKYKIRFSSDVPVSELEII